MKYIYARVSTSEQHIDQQIEYMKALVNDESAVVYAEKQSGKTVFRDELNALREVVQAGDEIYVQDISRVGRNTEEVLILVRELTEQGVKINVADLGNIDLTSPAGKMVLTVLASVQTMLREQMLEKQDIGIKRAKAEGKYKGKQASPETKKKFKEVQQYIRENGLSTQKAIKLAGISSAQFYRMKKLEEQITRDVDYLENEWLPSLRTK